MRNTGWLMAAVVLGIPCAANAQAVITERSLSGSAAAEAALGAIEACCKLGQHVTMTVLDGKGVLRMPAPWLPVPLHGLPDLVVRVTTERSERSRPPHPNPNRN